MATKRTKAKGAASGSRRGAGGAEADLARERRNARRRERAREKRAQEQAEALKRAERNARRRERYALKKAQEAEARRQEAEAAERAAERKARRAERQRARRAARRAEQAAEQAAQQAASQQRQSASESALADARAKYLALVQKALNKRGSAPGGELSERQRQELARLASYVEGKARDIKAAALGDEAATVGRDVIVTRGERRALAELASSTATQLRALRQGTEAEKASVLRQVVRRRDVDVGIEAPQAILKLERQLGDYRHALDVAVAARSRRRQVKSGSQQDAIQAAMQVAFATAQSELPQYAVRYRTHPNADGSVDGEIWIELPSAEEIEASGEDVGEVVRRASRDLAIALPYDDRFPMTTAGQDANVFATAGLMTGGDFADRYTSRGFYTPWTHPVPIRQRETGGHRLVGIPLSEEGGMTDAVLQRAGEITRTRIRLMWRPTGERPDRPDWR